MKTLRFLLARPGFWAGLALLALPGSVAAEEVKDRPKAVIELFTSQGCTSCPPADALLEELGARKDVIGLAYHVDYWDYIGWADTFGDRANSDHQRAYAARRSTGRIYTPQVVVNGAEAMVGSRRDEVTGALAQARLVLPVALTVADGMLEVSIDGQAGLEESLVWLVTYRSRAVVSVERGENRGRELAYTQIVTGRQILGMWEPGSGTHLKLPLEEVLSGDSDGAVILVQEDNHGLPGPILGAASYRR